VFWELNDRGINFDFVEPQRRARLAEVLERLSAGQGLMLATDLRKRLFVTVPGEQAGFCQRRTDRFGLNGHQTWVWSNGPVNPRSATSGQRRPSIQAKCSGGAAGRERRVRARTVATTLMCARPAVSRCHRPRGDYRSPAQPAGHDGDRETLTGQRPGRRSTKIRIA
jgi:hypothetical protein